MLEKTFLLTGISLLVGSANAALFSDQIVPQQNTLASIENKNLDDHAVAPIRRFMVEQKNNQKKVAILDMKNAKPIITNNKKTTYEKTQIISQETEQSKTEKIHPAIDKPDISIKHRLIANEIIQKMPQKCQNTLKNFYVRYEETESRGLGGKSTIILSGRVPDDEFRALFIHEFGHLIDLGCIQGSAYGKATQYKDGNETMKDDDLSISFYKISWQNSHTKKINSKPEDFVSGYAQWDMFEDFAESFTYFILHKKAFEERALNNPAIAAKYNWFVKNLPEIELNIEYEENLGNEIPWDITKLAYKYGE